MIMEKILEDVSAVFPDDMPEEEALCYVERGISKFGKKLREIEIQIAEDDENDVILRYDVDPVRFNRLRRITGYLVGDLNRWNNGKRAEEKDRVKHGVE